MVADRLIGRAAELRASDCALANLDGGRLATVELVDEPGIGNTRLLAELAGRAEAGGALVLQGSATESELDWPFRVFVDALDEHVHGMATQRFETLDALPVPNRAREAVERGDHDPALTTNPASAGPEGPKLPRGVHR